MADYTVLIEFMQPNSNGTDLKNLRERLRAAQKTVSLSQIAREANVSRSTLWGILSDRVREGAYQRGPNRSTVEAIERALAEFEQGR